MSFMTADVVRYATEKEIPAAEIDQIKARAAEAVRDYGGADGEFAHSKLNLVLGRMLAEQYRAEHSVPA